MFVAPHKKISREVTEADMEELFNIAMNMGAAFANPNCVAVAHPQINDKDPLRMYLTRQGYLVINPEIIRHSNYTVDSKEGCMTFLDRKPIIKQRWQKIEVRLQTMSHDGKLSPPVVAKLSGKEAWIAQHEIDHLNGKYCYDDKE